MTKRNQIILIFAIAIILGLVLGIFLRKKEQEPANIIKKESTSPSYEVNTDALKIDGKKVLGLTPGKESEEIKNLKVANTSTSNWSPALEATIKKQGGKSLKNVEIKHVDSFVLVQDKQGIFVESAVVTITNDQNAQTSFRVLVDSQNGKILRNWDQPIIDPANPRQNFRLKIDPRYHD